MFAQLTHLHICTFHRLPHQPSKCFCPIENGFEACELLFRIFISRILNFAQHFCDITHQNITD